jgi:hypothetical protein
MHTPSDGVAGHVSDNVVRGLPVLEVTLDADRGLPLTFIIFQWHKNFM